VIAGHTNDGETATELLGHQDPHVRAAALGALERMETLDTTTRCAAMADPHPSVRRRACLLSGRAMARSEIPPAELDALIAVLSSDTDAAVVESAAWALGEAAERAGTAARVALEHVAAEHTDALCREAAVAALGAGGDPAALDAVIAALADKPAIRRRAAVALAAFDDPRADDALARCLDDRDWQVRQIAEDLLGHESGGGP
jgi:HEAT repeat protein